MHVSMLFMLFYAFMFFLCFCFIDFFSFAGVRSLYFLCVDYVAEKCDFSTSLLERILPPHIENDISQRREKRANIVHHEYVSAQL